MDDKTSVIERINRELTAALNDLTLLYTVSQCLSSILEIDELIAAVKKIFCEKFPCEGFALYFNDPQHGHLAIATHKGLSAATTPPVNRDDVALETLRQRVSLYLPEACLFSVPLVLRDSVVGVLCVTRRPCDAFSPTDRQCLESIASQIAAAYDRSQLYTKTRELAVRDELTGVYNRRHFHETFRLEVKRAERFHHPISVLMIDVDLFKQFNDRFGHVTGDDVLKKLAHLLKSSIRETDVLARFGGEEFVLMLPDTGHADAVGVAEKLRDCVRRELKVITISVGVSSYPESVSHPKELVHTADIALYMAKRSGRDQVGGYRLTQTGQNDMILAI